MSLSADQVLERSERVGLAIVRNGVTHDARVQRAACTMRIAGLSPLIVGVVTDDQSERRTVEGGTSVLRLDPRSPLHDVAKRLLRVARRNAHAPGAAPALATQSAVPSSPSPSQRLARLLRTADYYRRAISVVLRLRPQLVHANDYNTMWIGVAAKLLTGSRLVYDAHELWPDRNGRWESRRWLMACEALFVRVADVVVTASPGYAACMARRYRIAPPSVVRNIPNATGSADHAPAPSSAPPRVVYVGGMLTGRGLEQTIDALALVPAVRLTLVGPGSRSYVDQLRERAAAAGVSDRVDFRDPVPPDELGAAMAGACLGLSIIQPVCLSYELTLPNKLFEYLAAGLPVLVSDLPVMSQFVAEHGIGAAVAPDDPAAIAAALDRLTAPAAQRELAPNVRAAAAALTWPRERERLLTAYGCVPERGTR